MISEHLQRAMAAAAQMSYETWVSILLAALGVLLAVVTLIVAIAGIVIAIVGIWGFKGLREFAQQRADDAVKQAMAGYPDAGDFVKVHEAMLELYRRMQQRMSEFKQEFEILHQQSEAANAILDRLNPERKPDASNQAEAIEPSVDTIAEPMSATYPGEEAGFNDGNIGKSIKHEGNSSTDPR
jgi:hypothetical protein